MEDFRGKVIRPGDWIAYATRRASHMELHEACVIEAYFDKIRVTRLIKESWQTKPSTVTLTVPSYIAVLQRW
jgi:hypothetical protein